MKKSHALNLGLVLAAVSIILFLITAIVDGGMTFGIVMVILSLSVTIAACIIFLKKQRTEQAGLLSFKEGFLTSFVGLLIAGLITVLFTFVYANYIDASYVDRTVEKSLEMTMKFMEGSVSEDIIAEQLEKAEEDIRFGFTLPGAFKSLGFYAIFYLILALIFGASMKKNEESLGQ